MAASQHIATVTPDYVRRLHNGDRTRPYVQLLAPTIMQETDEPGMPRRRYQFTVSDGTNCIAALLSHRLNRLVEMEEARAV